jgi:hypothetical protein
MTPLDLLCGGSLVAITLTQTLLVAWFDRICRTQTAKPFPPDRCLAPARIVLCLRGSDPFLGDTIRAAATQDHPDYELRIVIDSAEDPAWDEAHRAIASVRPTGRVRIEALAERPVTSSLKCAGLLQGLRGVEREAAVVAFLDADVVPATDWLRTLAGTLADDSCGVVTGNRWYSPPDWSPGSWTRAGWNAGALVQMVCFGIPWGGTLGLRTELLEAAGLRDKWAASFCEDTLLPMAIDGTGKRVRFVPSLIAVNQERVTLAALYPWIARQLLTARLYHPAWAAVAIFGLSAPVAVAASVAAVRWAAVRGDAAAVMLLAACLAAFLLSLPVLFVWIGRIVARSVPGRASHAVPLVPLLWGVLSAQCVYVAALLTAMVMRSARWRGARYAIDGPWNIRLVDDSRHPAVTAARLHSM